MEEPPQASDALAASVTGAASPATARKTTTLALAGAAGLLLAAVPYVIRHTGSATAPGSATAAAASSPALGAPGRANEAMAPSPCVDCAEVVAIRTLRKDGDSSGVGAVGGGLVGAIAGHQVGAGRGKEAMTVLGAIGGVLGGNEVEKKVKATTQYLVDLRMADGSMRTLAQGVPPPYTVGTPVRVRGNTIAAR